MATPTSLPPAAAAPPAHPTSHGDDVGAGEGPQPTIHTYHCICNQLLLASTHTLSSLARRQPPCLDRAHILHLPPPPRRPSSASPSSSSASSSPSDDDNDDDINNTTNEKDIKSNAAEQQQPQPPPQPQPQPQLADNATQSAAEEAGKPRQKKKKKKQQGAPNSADKGYSMLLSTMVDRRPVLVQREDGFDKRWLWRCGRCRVVVGYELDGLHFVDAAGGAADGGGSRREGQERGKIVYLLPGGLVGTEDMVAGKTLSDQEVDLV